ncbi:sensor histidine kinase [Sphingobium sp. DEHP117]|uniref:sensor histidine kinase n=1 Tax=Sphingobium sp. DEHP117 TaxID=2993436 RepID=UPI0027D73E5C|nr:histidine kinase dimerization/phosphoacceptor domain -containing protein [Sphingobium sp. DEHP117]MDQ4419412.1 sensor histidine kinase [Sphingobium sp. DEHP117]
MSLLFALAAVVAAMVSWYLARRLLVRPLVILRRELATYRPGKILNPPAAATSAAQEIAELSEAFHALTRDVARHEDEMQRALADQTRLTREVHHRVKNNLQIISSLISLHWRATDDPGKAAAYLSIQRRVDALAVVQRNHYAELEHQNGVRARVVLNEIVASLRTSAQIQGDGELDFSVEADDILLHHDVAAPVAFMTAELADLAISQGATGTLYVSLKLLEDDRSKACLTLQLPPQQESSAASQRGAELCGRVLGGLARQLRTPLDHDGEAGRYSLVIPVAG